MKTSVFAAKRAEMFETIHVKLAFTDRLVGGCPKDPKMIEGWLKKNMGIDDELELLELTRQHLLEMGVDVPSTATREEIQAAVEKIASELKTQGFKRLDGDPYLEERNVKAGIKESVNVLFAGERWGIVKGYQGKGPKSYVAERVFVKPDRIPLGPADTVRVDMAVGHVNGPQGPRSTIGYYEYVDRPEVEFDILQLREQKQGGNGEPALTHEQWAQVLTHLELNGFGAMRSQGHGQFVVTHFAID